MDSFLHNHKKRKDSPEVSLDQVLFAAELEFSKILVPRLPQNTRNVNNGCAEKPKQLYYLRYQLLGALIPLFYCSDINLCFQLVMSGGNCAVMHVPCRGLFQGQHCTGATLEEYFCSYYSWKGD